MKVSQVKLFKGKKVAIIGDIMLDRFTEGVIIKKSPEANAPVVLWKKENNVLGGAANVAANVRTLGGIPFLFSVVGDDDTGKAIQSLLKKAKISNLLIKDKNRETTLKTRIYANEEYLLRLDREVRYKISKKFANNILENLSKNIKTFDVIVFSDYDKGVLSKYLVKKVINLARKNRVPIIADVKPNNFLFYKGVTFVKPNKMEAIKMGGKKDLKVSAKNISNILNSDVLVTKGENGMLLYSNMEEQFFEIKGRKTKAKDIVGAGDVVSATLALALASQMGLVQAALIANIAASLSVEKHGTTAITIKEVLKHI